MRMTSQIRDLYCCNNENHGFKNSKMIYASRLLTQNMYDSSGGISGKVKPSPYNNIRQFLQLLLDNQNFQFPFLQTSFHFTRYSSLTLDFGFLKTMYFII
jgi:hypothetical protein